MKNLSGFARSMNFLAGNCRILWKILEASFRSCQDMQQESKWQWTWGGENCTGESGLRAHQSGNTSTIGGSIISTSSAVKMKSNSWQVEPNYTIAYIWNRRKIKAAQRVQSFERTNWEHVSAILLNSYLFYLILPFFIFTERKTFWRFAASKANLSDEAAKAHTLRRHITAQRGSEDEIFSTPRKTTQPNVAWFG